MAPPSTVIEVTKPTEHLKQQMDEKSIRSWYSEYHRYSAFETINTWQPLQDLVQKSDVDIDAFSAFGNPNNTKQPSHPATSNTVQWAMQQGGAAQGDPGKSLFASKSEKPSAACAFPTSKEIPFIDPIQARKGMSPKKHTTGSLDFDAFCVFGTHNDSTHVSSIMSSKGTEQAVQHGAGIRSSQLPVQPMIQKSDAVVNATGGRAHQPTRMIPFIDPVYAREPSKSSHNIEIEAFSALQAQMSGMLGMASMQQMTSAEQMASMPQMSGMAA